MSMEVLPQMDLSNCPFASDELALLRKFRNVCEAVMSCRFVQDLPKQKHSFKAEKLPDGTVRTEYPTYDGDDFLAFLTHYRKLVANKEETNIFKVLKLIGKRATDEERVASKTIRKVLVAEAQRPPLQMAIGTPGNERTYTPEAIQNIIFNGHVFHTDDDLPEDLRKLLDFDPFTKLMFLRYATIVVDQSWVISGVLKNRGYI